MKKKVIFCIENFHHGGITKALENIISLIDHDKIDLCVFAVNQENGPYKHTFSPYLKYRQDKLLTAFCTNYRNHTGLSKYTLLIIKIIRKLGIKLGVDIFEKYLQLWAKRIHKDNYDCIIAFAEGYITKFVSKIPGHKIAWVHIDYKRHLDYENNINEVEIYNSFDKIIIPSYFSKKSFLEIMPNLRSRVIAIPNLINTSSVKKLSIKNEQIDPKFKKHGFTLISVGRICYEKGFIQIPKIAEELNKYDIEFRWYIIGGGSDVETNHLKNAISKYDMEKHIILLGQKTNPYIYIKQADLLISTSISETFSYAIFEAKSLGIPVICANFGTATEIINQCEGVICETHQMAKIIFNLCSNNQIQSFKNYLNNYKYDNDTILNKLYEII